MHMFMSLNVAWTYFPARGSLHSRQQMLIYLLDYGAKCNAQDNSGHVRNLPVACVHVTVMHVSEDSNACE